MLEGPVVDDMDLLQRQAQRVNQLAASVLRMGDHGIDRVVQTPLRGGLTGSRLTREQIVGVSTVGRAGRR